MGFMRAGEGPENSNPADKTARDHALTHLVSLLREEEPIDPHGAMVYGRNQNHISRFGNAHRYQSDE
jgi:hypothetical protein